MLREGAHALVPPQGVFWVGTYILQLLLEVWYVKSRDKWDE